MNYFAVDKLAIYEEEYLEQYVLELKSYYQQEAAENISKMSTKGYLEEASTRLEQELDRNRKYLFSSKEGECFYNVIEELKNRATFCFEKVYIEDHISRLNAFFCQMIELESAPDCLLAYNFIKRIPFGLEAPVACFKTHILKCLKFLVSSLSRADQQVTFLSLSPN
jgi:hypothetical protein